MNSDVFKGAWREVRGSARAKWSKLTDDDLLRVNGKIEELVGVVQRRYGCAKDDARRQVESFADVMQKRIERRRRHHAYSVTSD